MDISTVTPARPTSPAPSANPISRDLYVGFINKITKGEKITFLCIFDLATMQLVELIPITTPTLGGVLPILISFLNSLSPDIIVNLFHSKFNWPFSSHAFSKSILILKAVDSYSALLNNKNILTAKANLRLVLNGFPVINGTLDTNSAINRFNGVSL
jgi:hypothetical protein